MARPASHHDHHGHDAQHEDPLHGAHPLHAHPRHRFHPLAREDHRRQRHDERAHRRPHEASAARQPPPDVAGTTQRARPPHPPPRRRPERHPRQLRERSAAAPHVAHVHHEPRRREHGDEGEQGAVRHRPEGTRGERQPEHAPQQRIGPEPGQFAHRVGYGPRGVVFQKHERVVQRPRAPPARRRGARQTAHHHLGQVGRHPRRHRAQRRRRAVHALLHQRVVRFPGERLATGQHRVPHRAERVDVAPRVHVARAHRLLRRHVARRADDHPRGGQAVAGALPLGDPEVGEHRATGVGVEQDVGGLDVAVDHAAAVRAVERIGQLHEDPLRLRRSGAAARSAAAPAA